MAPHPFALQQGCMSRMEAMRRTFAWATVRRSLAVALLVGTALNLINQGDALLGEAKLVPWKLMHTNFVPFAVSSYGSYAALRSN